MIQAANPMDRQGGVVFPIVHAHSREDSLHFVRDKRVGALYIGYTEWNVPREDSHGAWVAHVSWKKMEKWAKIYVTIRLPLRVPRFTCCTLRSSLEANPVTIILSFRWTRLDITDPKSVVFTSTSF